MRGLRLVLGAVISSLLLGGWGCTQRYDAKEMEGVWDCSVSWTWDNDGTPVPCGVVQQASCQDGKMSSVGVVSLGQAQWDERIEGTCDVEGDELVTTRTLSQTVPRNDEARRFEEEHLEGQTLSHEPPDPKAKIHSRILSYTGAELVFVGDEGRTVTCRRP